MLQNVKVTAPSVTPVHMRFKPFMSMSDLMKLTRMSCVSPSLYLLTMSSQMVLEHLGVNENVEWCYPNVCSLKNKRQVYHGVVSLV